MSRLPSSIDELKLFTEIHSADEKKVVASLANIRNLGFLRDDKIGTILHVIAAKDDKEEKDMPAKVGHIVDKLRTEGTLFDVLNTFNNGKIPENPLQMEIRNRGNNLLSSLAAHPMLSTQTNLDKLKDSLQKLNTESKSVVDYSFLYGSSNAVETLKKLGIPLKTYDGSSFITASRIGDRADRQMFIQDLLLMNDPDIKAQIDYQGVGGYTAMHHLIREKDDVSVRLLLDHKADPSILFNSYNLTRRRKNYYEYAVSLKKDVNDTSYDAVISVLEPYKNAIPPQTTSILSRIGLFVNKNGSAMLNSVSKTVRESISKTAQELDGFGGFPL